MTIRHFMSVLPLIGLGVALEASGPRLSSSEGAIHGSASIAAILICSPESLPDGISVIRARFFTFTDTSGIHTQTLQDGEGIAQLQVRGASSRLLAKKSYRFELQNASGEDVKLPLLGLPMNSDWILYASYMDKTFARDALAYDIWRDLGYWAPRMKYVELFVSTNFGSSVSPTPEDLLRTANYEGLYVLVEKIKRGPERVNTERVNIAKLTGSRSGDEPSGGYILKKDRLGPGEAGITLAKTKTLFTLVEPKERNISSAQTQWLSNYLNDFETALFGPDFRDPEQGYAAYIDVDSFIDYHWINDFGNNLDGFRFSQFYHKDRGGKLKMGPLWDWDLSFGNPAYAEIWKTNRWRSNEMSGDTQEYAWFKRLFEDPDFLQRYIDRWSQLRANILSESNLLARVDRLANEVRPHVEKNYDRWPKLRHRFNPTIAIGPTYEDEVTHLKNWIKGRLAWIDSQDFPKPILTVIALSNSVSRPLAGPHASAFAGSSLPPLLSTSFPSVKENPALDSASSLHTSSLSMSCQPGAGSIFYTTNSTDPRVPGGHVSTNAINYTAPIPITAGLQVRARVMSDFGLWSAPANFP
jgi:hypothetical protein